jgi:hypothetical protein
MRTSHRYAGILLLLMCMLLFGALPATAQPTAPDTAARQAAEAWMTLVATGDFSASWDEAGELFRAGTTAADWAADADAGQRQVGDLVVRELADLLVVTDPPGAPPAEYVLLRYRSEFTLAGVATETVFLVREAERGWRVIGYFVHPADA